MSVETNKSETRVNPAADRAAYFRKTREQLLSTAKDAHERMMLEKVDLENIPRHVAFIMDGNGRWAKKRRMPRIFGHRKGMETVRKILYGSRDLGVEFTTLYAFSAENWTRPRAEVTALMHLLQEYLRREIEELDSMNVKLLAIGDVSRLPLYARRELDKAMEFLSKNNGQRLVLALNYGGRAELTRMARRIATQVVKGELKPEAITDRTVRENLYTADIPDPDLMIRTSGEVRLSNFLLWQLAYAEFHITQTLWPDFTRAEYFSAIVEYQHRERRFGGVGAGTDSGESQEVGSAQGA